MGKGTGHLGNGFPKPNPKHTPAYTKGTDHQAWLFPLFLFFVRDILDKVAGLAFQSGAHLFQNINRNMFCRTGAKSGNCGRADTGHFGKVFLVHIIHSKQNFRPELYHISTFFPSNCITQFVFFQLITRKNIKKCQENNDFLFTNNAIRDIITNVRESNSHNKGGKQNV